MEKFKLCYFDVNTGEVKNVIIRNIKQFNRLVFILNLDRLTYERELYKLRLQGVIPDLKRARFEIIKEGLVWIE